LAKLVHPVSIKGGFQVWRAGKGCEDRKDEKKVLSWGAGTKDVLPLGGPSVGKLVSRGPEEPGGTASTEIAGR